MDVGDRVTIPFAKGTKEGILVRVFEKSAWVKVDFPRHPGKLLRRKLSDLKAAEKRTSRRTAAKGSKKKVQQTSKTRASS